MCCISVGVVDADAAPYAPAMFIFGDSLADFGNNNFIPEAKFRANITPYGISAFPKPTGRFSDGLLTFDYIATYLGLRSPRRFLSARSRRFSRGINFASAGSGLLDSTGKRENIMPLRHQIEQFQKLSNNFIKAKGSKHPHGSKNAKSLIANSLFCISTASNDLGAFFSDTLGGQPPKEPIIAELHKIYEHYISELYKSGARKFLVVDVPPLGCTPLARYKNSFSPGACFDLANYVTMFYNIELRDLVNRLNQNLDGASIIIFKSYSYVMDMIENGEPHGFSETKQACCGSGELKVEVLCGKTTEHCEHPNTHLFWDWTHPTQKAAKIFASQIWSGNSSIMEPFNLSTLILAGK
ncbi:hypothetical protein SUGI_0083100 [Cryptomeria japonica]|uniref:GDSL esterase/lipase 6-like n=1 Tax=Cryptomeria japonica TaxID=3369 RepID=UPI002408A76A|nr:GDSL esterase/lipase 6-like [Cryptomeria japonica]GLJ08178.1 hypothetical protein SUGI_0083100 [Cryptomeria japonica]